MAAVVFVVLVPKEREASLVTPKPEIAEEKVQSEDLLKIPAQKYLKPIPSILTERSESVIDFLEDDVPLEKALRDALIYFEINNSSWISTDDGKFYQVIFICDADHTEDMMKRLALVGIGAREDSTMSIVQCAVHVQKEIERDPDSVTSESDQEVSEEMEMTSSRKSQFKKSIKSRLTVAQVVDGVRYVSLLTFDYVMLLILAGIIAALGLVENSSVILVASMLISPLMGPILGGTFGIVIRDVRLRNLGLKSELIGLAICLLCGFGFGLLTGNFDRMWSDTEWPTTEMKNRGDIRSLWVGALIALPSGAGVALSILGGNQGSLVGVAISASLLPPAVNAGLLWSLSLIRGLKSLGEESLSYNETTITKPSLQLPRDYVALYYPDNMANELAVLGFVSLLLTIINILCIFVMGLLVLKIKEVAPYTSTSNTRGFWKQDIKIARDYNKTVKVQAAKNLGKQFLEEWAHLNKIDPKRALEANIEDDKATEIALTFKDMVEEIEEDSGYHDVLRGLHRNMPTPLSRQIPPEWRKLENQSTIEQSVYHTLHNVNPPHIHSRSRRPTDVPYPREVRFGSSFGSPNSVNSPLNVFHKHRRSRQPVIPEDNLSSEHETEVPQTRFRISKIKEIFPKSPKRSKSISTHGKSLLKESPVDLTHQQSIPEKDESESKV